MLPTSSEKGKLIAPFTFSLTRQKQDTIRKDFFRHPFGRSEKVLKPGGEVCIKTDHDGYAEWMQCVIENQQDFDCIMSSKNLRDEFPEHFKQIHHKI